jgi:hypothetical protein
MGLSLNLKKNRLGVPFSSAYVKISHVEYINGPEGQNIRFSVEFFASKNARFSNAWAQSVECQTFEIAHSPGMTIPDDLYSYLKTLGDYEDPKGFAADFGKAKDELVDPPRPNPYPNPDDIPGGLANPLHPDHQKSPEEKGHLADEGPEVTSDRGILS